MADNVQVKITKLVYDVDGGSVSKSKRANSDLIVSFDDLSGSAKTVEKEFDEARESMTRMIKVNKQVSVGASKANKTLKGQADGLRGVSKEAETLTDRLNRLDKANSQVRGQVGALGDVGSAGRTIGGAAGAFGNTELERSVSILAEIPDTLEAIPQLVASFPAAFSAAQVALTGTTVAVGGLTFSLGLLLLPIAAIAASVAIATRKNADYKKQIDAGVDALRTEIDARENTTAEIQEQIDTLEQQRDANAEVTKALTEAKDAGGLLGTVFLGTNKRLKEAQAEAGDTQLQIEGLNRALESSQVAANDAAMQEQALADARVATATRDAEFQVRVEESSKERLEAEQEAIDATEKRIKREIELLKESGDTSEIVNERIGELNDQLAELAERTILVKEASKTAVSDAEDTAEASTELADALKEAEKEQEKFAGTVERSEQKIADEVQRGADKRESVARKQSQRLEDLAIKTAQAEMDALTKLREKQADAILDLERSFADDGRQQRIDERQDKIEFQRGEAESATEHAQRLQRIRLDAERDEEDLIRDRDFAGLARSRRDTARKLADESQSFNDGRKERLQEFKQSQVDSRNAFIQEREQRIIEFNRQLADIQTQAKREAQQRRINFARREQEIVKSANRELVLLQQTEAKKLSLLADALQAQLDLFSSATRVTQSAKKEVEKSEKTDSGGTTATPPSSTGGGSVPKQKTLASGGRLMRGETATVNELGTETFTPDGGSPFRLPAGRGQFKPARSGRVNPAGDSGGLMIAVDIGGIMVNDRSQILSEATRIFQRDLERAVRGIGR